MAEMAKELLDMGDYVVGRTLDRLAGLSDLEHQWKPMPGAWTVLVDGTVEHANPYERPKDVPPITTIAWRLWHIGNQTLCGFAQSGFDIDPLGGLPIDRWYPDARTSVDALRRAWAGYRTGITEERVHAILGPKFKPWEHASYAAQVLHVLDEVVHHGAEVSMLRDVYRVGGIR